MVRNIVTEDTKTGNEVSGDTKTGNEVTEDTMTAGNEFKKVANYYDYTECFVVCI